MSGEGTLQTIVRRRLGWAGLNLDGAQTCTHGPAGVLHREVKWTVRFIIMLAKRSRPASWWVRVGGVVFSLDLEHVYNCQTLIPSIFTPTACKGDTFIKAQVWICVRSAHECNPRHTPLFDEKSTKGGFPRKKTAV